MSIKLSMSHEAFMVVSQEAYEAGVNYGRDIAVLGMAAVELYHLHKRNTMYINRFLRAVSAVEGVTYVQARAWLTQLNLVAHQIEAKSQKVDKTKHDANYCLKQSDVLVAKSRGWRGRLKKNPDFREYKRATIEKKFEAAMAEKMIESIYGRIDSMMKEHGNDISEGAKETLTALRSVSVKYLNAKNPEAQLEA